MFIVHSFLTSNLYYTRLIPFWVVTSEWCPSPQFCVSWAHWCCETTKLQDQDQDHVFFQDQDRSGQDQDFFKTFFNTFFKTKTAFFKDPLIINSRLLVQQQILIERGLNWKDFCDVILVT